jgi:predicted DNA-binding transcriptional regulator YafY
MERKRLVADRFRRIWHIVEDIAETPGKSRRELADKFHLSERQVQADLNIIRTDMHLPLVRRQGYRFVAEQHASPDGLPGGTGTFDLREAQLLVLILRQAQRDRTIPPDRLQSLMRKLPAMFPAHLQPLVQRTLEAVTSARGGAQQQAFAAIADGLLRGTWLRLHYPPGDLSTPIADPIVRPELLLPYLNSWYVIGECRQRNRTMMFNLDAVQAVTMTAEG